MGFNVSTIRRIQIGDGPRLRALRLRALETDPQAFGSSYELEVDIPPDIWEGRATSSASGPRRYIAVAEGEDEFVGMAGGYQPEGKPEERALWGMWVAPERRRQSIGLGLVEEVRKWARQSGANRLTLWVVESNTAAVTLYRQIGFVDTAETQPLPSDPSLTEVKLSSSLARIRDDA